MSPDDTTRRWPRLPAAPKVRDARLFIRVLALAAALCVAPQAKAEQGAPEQAGRTAKRVVSLDYCADQFVLKLVDRERILAVSPNATAAFSYMRESAAGLRQVPPNAEDVLILQPDLAVRSYGGGANARAFLERSGVGVVQIGFASSIDDVKDQVRHVATALGERDRGEDVIEQMNARIADLPPAAAPRLRALYMTPAGVTSGPGTLVHDMLITAGLANIVESRGWRSLPLEQITYDPPDLIAAAFFEVKTNHRQFWSATRHPVARRQLRDLPMVPLQGAWTACGGWFLMDAIEALAAARQDLEAQP